MNLATVIDHTLLSPAATREQLRKLCREAWEHKFWAVCVNPYFVSQAVKELSGSGVKVCTVVGFPLGATAATIKAAEAKLALEQGAQEIDMVMNISAAKSDEWDVVEAEIKMLSDLCHRSGAILKVILETTLLTDAEKMRACQAAMTSQADFVKTSTGFAGGGANVSDVSLMRKTVGDKLGVKASGGIKDKTSALAMLEAGANRLGTSSGVAILDGGSGSGY